MPKKTKQTPLGLFAERNALRVTFKKVPSRPDGEGWGPGTKHYKYTLTRTDMRLQGDTPLGDTLPEN